MESLPQSREGLSIILENELMPELSKFNSKRLINQIVLFFYKLYNSPHKYPLGSASSNQKCFQSISVMLKEVSIYA